MPGFNLGEAVVKPLSEAMGRALGHVEGRALPPMGEVAGEIPRPATTSFRAPAQSIKQEIPGVARALSEPAIPEESLRGTAESPTVASRSEARGLPVRPYAPSVTTQVLDPQYRIDPSLEDKLSQTYDSYSPWEERLQKVKTFLGGFFSPTPNMPKDIQAKMLDARTRVSAADEAAARDLAAQLSPLSSVVGKKGEPAFNATLMFRQLKIADALSYMDDSGIDVYQGIERPVWEDANNKLIQWVKDNPHVQEASANIRSGLDEIFNDMVNRGWIIPDRYREQYTPMKKINSVLSSLGDMTGETSDQVKSRILSSMRHRPDAAKDAAIDESNMLHILAGARSEYYRKVAEHELFQKIINDPTINMTERYRGIQTLPADMGVYFPGQGMMGHTALSKEGRMLADAAKDIDPDAKVHVGGWILPKSLIEELKSFHPTPHSKAEEIMVKGGRKMAKYLTVYNPANTAVNLVSDAVVAMFGMPGEKAQPLGFLRWYAEGIKAGNAYVKGNQHWVTINGQRINLTDLMLQEGVGESSLVSDLSDRSQSAFLKQFIPGEEKKGIDPLSRLGKGMEMTRQSVELYPRIAAGLEALERTGDVKEFGRVARNITLNFGPGSPKMSKVPILRFMSPFLSFQGLATERLFKSLSMEGSRARTLAGMLAVPAAVFLWNSQNDEYKIAARSIGSSDKTTLPVVVPNPKDISKPLRDDNGNPVIIRMKYFVPEQVLQMAGLGNLPTRVSRVIEGRDTPADFLGDTAKGPFEAMKNLATVPAIFIEQASGKSALSGKPMSMQDRLERLIPFLRIPFSMGRELQNAGLDNIPAGLLPAGRAAMVEATGLRPMRTTTMVGHVFDADLKEAIAEQRMAQREFELAAASKDKMQKVRAARKLKDAIIKLRRIASIVESENIKMKRGNNGIDPRNWDPGTRAEYMQKQSEESRDIAREELRM